MPKLTSEALYHASFTTPVAFDIYRENRLKTNPNFAHVDERSPLAIARNNELQKRRKSALRNPSALIKEHPSALQTKGNHHFSLHPFAAAELTAALHFHDNFGAATGQFFRQRTSECLGWVEDTLQNPRQKSRKIETRRLYGPDYTDWRFEYAGLVILGFSRAGHSPLNS